MISANNKDDQNGGRFSIDAKLIGILSVFAFFGILLVIITILAAETLTALRSYATTQTHWTEVRKEAVGKLENYAATNSQRYLNDFQYNLDILQEVEKGRIELISDQTDPQRVISSFNHFPFTEDEIEDMIKLSNRFGGLPEFAEALRLWKVSDQQIDQLDSLASQINYQETPDIETQKEWIAKVEEIDNRLTDLQYDLALVLNQGSQRLENIIFWAAIGTGSILFLIAGFMSWRFRRSIRKWERALKMNTQRYRSLFDQNPNAVYSFDRNGKFVEGNKALENLLGISLDQIKGVTFDKFIHPSERERVRNLFEDAANGNPQTYETTGIDKQEEKVHLQITNLPIYIEDEIVGVYGIAQNIGERVQAEQKIQAQLEERTVLLEEIHHRVKNNLAFVSSMLILNEENIESEKARKQLRNAQNQIISIADIHEIFYETEDFSELPVKQYTEQILNRLFDTFELNGKTIEHKVEVGKDINLTIKKAIPFGLILNELATNSYKHAFKNKEEGVIEFKAQTKNGNCYVTYRDNGSGLSSDFNFEEMVQSSLGMRLVYTFLKQLDADYNLETGTENFRLEFEFPA